MFHIMPLLRLSLVASGASGAVYVHYRRLSDGRARGQNDDGPDLSEIAAGALFGILMAGYVATRTIFEIAHAVVRLPLALRAPVLLLPPNATEMVECPICQEPQQRNQLVSASLSPGVSCEHACCRQCMAEYLRTLRCGPIRCWSPGCRALVSIDLCRELFGVHSEPFDQLSRISNLHHADVAMIRCPNPRCSSEFIAPPRADEHWPEAECPACHIMMCVNCQVTWHQGYDCDEYQRLLEQKAEGDQAAERLAQQNDWQRCPNCKEMIEREPGGCNFMRCRCGTGFCYICGAAYESLHPTANNVHGSPGCGHLLFDDLGDV